MQNYILQKPRFSDFNGQALLKASIHLDLACEAQLAQMEPRYNLPLSLFVSQKLRWHIAGFNITYAKPIRGLDELRIEADVVKVEDCAMTVAFSFFDKMREKNFAFGEILFELNDANDKPVVISEEVKQSLVKFGKVK